jgi:hypothetical protein
MEMRKLAKMIPFILLAIMLTGCGSVASGENKSKEPTKIDVANFIYDTKELMAMFKDVYDNDRRELTADEESKLAIYESRYGENSDFYKHADSVSQLIVTEAIRSQHLAIKDPVYSRLEDFSESLSFINSLYDAIDIK